MKTLYDVARNLHRYPQISYDQMQEILYCKTPECEAVYRGNQITIQTGGKEFELEVADFEEGYCFFRWLLKKKISLEPRPDGFWLCIRNYQRFMRQKLQPKRAHIVRRILETLIGVVLAGWHMLMLLVGLSYFENDWTNYVAALYCMLLIIAGVALVVHVNRRHPMRIRDVLKLVLGVIILCIVLFLSLVFISTWFEESEVPIGGSIAIVVLLLPFGAAGVWLIHNAFWGSRKNADRLLMRKPQFPPLEQAQALWTQIMADSPEVVVLSPAEDWTSQVEITASKLGGTMVAAGQCSPMHVYGTQTRENDTEPYPILQLNLADLPEDSPLALPKEGLLQLCLAPYGDTCKLLYHRTFDTLEDGETSTLAVDEAICYDDSNYAWGEMPICVHLEKTVYYDAEEAKGLMQAAAEKLGIPLSEDLLFGELMHFLHQEPEKSAWLGLLSSENGDLSVTLVDGCSKDGKSGLQLGGKDWMTWRITAQELAAILS